jgi:hypothetical protein
MLKASPDPGQSLAAPRGEPQRFLFERARNALLKAGAISKRAR